MIKVLQVLSDTNIGGAGRLLINYLHNFDRSLFDVRVVLPRASLLTPAVEAEGYEVIEIDSGRDKSLDLRAAYEISKIIKAWRPDIVHTHSAFFGKLAAFFCRVPSRFYTRHSAFEPPNLLRTFPIKQINGLINNTLATDIVAVAEAAKDNLTDTGVNEKKISVIINGVEEMRRLSEAEKSQMRHSLGIGDETFVCGISARLEDYKGHSYLLCSAKTVLSVHPNTCFLIIGCGSCEEKLKKQAEVLGIADKVIFTGFVSDVSPYYNVMDLNLNCSWGTETSCLALSEGMSLGVPAVATTYGGNPYMITDGVNGFLVPEKDSSAMAEQIVRLIEDRNLLSVLSAGARKMYEKKFTARAMTNQLETLYLSSVKRSKKSTK